MVNFANGDLVISTLTTMIVGAPDDRKSATDWHRLFRKSDMSLRSVEVGENPLRMLGLSSLKHA